MKTLMLCALLTLPTIAGAQPAAPQTHTIAIENLQFTPQTLTIKRGDRVVWANRDLVPHTATAAKAFDSRSIASNASWTYVARTPGRYDYSCTFHPMMKATLVVE
jgi:plastocyanin